MDDYADPVLVEQLVERPARPDLAGYRAPEKVPDRAVDISVVNQLDVLGDLAAHELGERDRANLGLVRDAVGEPVDETRAL